MKRLERFPPAGAAAQNQSAQDFGERHFITFTRGPSQHVPAVANTHSEASAGPQCAQIEFASFVKRVIFEPAGYLGIGCGGLAEVSRCH